MIALAVRPGHITLTTRNTMYEKRLCSPGQFGIFCTTPIRAGTVLFTHDDWVADESRGWETLHVDDLDGLTKEERRLYLRYAYDVSFGEMIGTFDWSRAQHVSNFMNHSCAPNMTYGDDDDIIAVRDIAFDEELTIDYANFTVNVDQLFSCRCETPACRHRILKNDWIQLAQRAGFNFPRFMHSAVASLDERRRSVGGT